jgi:tRNA threonylcarbamoyladenosine biosynthesis protein TsaE
MRGAEFISHAPAETEALGCSWGENAEPGLVVALSGDLGAGKTQLVKGLARGMGCVGRVHSPTFALVNIYSGGRMPLYHLDLYRLEAREQIRAAGLEEFLNPKGVSVIEWAERWFSRPDAPVRDAETPRKLRWVTLSVLGDTERRITYEDFGV